MRFSHPARILKWLARLAWRVGLVFVGFSVVVVAAFRWLDPPTTAFMVQARAQDVRIYHHWVPLERIAPVLQTAVIAAEDQRFAEHHGLDGEAISDAVEEGLAGGRLRGASTITQQTAKNLFLWPGRNYLRKGMEAWFALLMDAAWPKPRILEIYLNVAEFGEGVYGAHAAAAVYFGKPPAKLNAEEAALLAAALPSPRRLDPAAPGDYLRRRQAWILEHMHRLGGERYLDRLE